MGEYKVERQEKQERINWYEGKLLERGRRERERRNATEIRNRCLEVVGCLMKLEVPVNDD